MIAHGAQAHASVPRRRSRHPAAPPVLPAVPSTPVHLLPPSDSPPASAASAGSASPLPADDARYAVEKIVDTREQDGNLEFLIRWVGFSSVHDTWQDADEIDVDPIAAFYGWAPAEKLHEKFEHALHPKLGQAQPDWRRKKSVREAKHDKPRYTQRFTPDSAEREESRGWKAKQLKHNRHLDFAKQNKEYTAGLKTQPAAGAGPGMWADLWVPREVWNLESTQSNIYAEQKLKAKLEAGRDLDSADHAYARHNGFSPDSVKLFHCIQMLIHGDHHIAYDVDHCWGDDPCRNFGGWIKDRMSRDYYRAHCRYLHFADNEGDGMEIDDPAGKTRDLRELLQSILRENIHPGGDWAIDETSLDTESRKVWNRQRLRFKPSCNEGVLYDMNSDSLTGYPYGYQESRSDPDGDNSLNSVVDRLVTAMIEQRGAPSHIEIFTDSRYTCPELCEILMKKNVYITGTVTKGRIGMPTEEIEAIFSAGLEWGEFTVLSKGDMEIVIWCDRAMVMFLTTGFSSTVLGHVIRKRDDKCDWTRLQVPYIVQAYNQNYDGVDHTNQILKNGSSFGHVRVLRHPRKQASFFKDINLSASYIMFRVAGVKACAHDEAAVEKFVNGCSKANFCNSVLHYWGDPISFKGPTTGSPISVLNIIEGSPAASIMTKQLAKATIATCNASLHSAASGASASMVGAGVVASRKRKQTRGRPPLPAKKQDIKSVTILSGANATPSGVVPLEGQREHKLRNMYKHGMKGGRDCSVCSKGGGYYSKGGKPTLKQTGWRCIKCKRYMCEVCYLLHKNHIGFNQVVFE